MRSLCISFLGCASAFVAPTFPTTLSKTHSSPLSITSRQNALQSRDDATRSKVLARQNSRLFADASVYDETCDVLVLGSGPAGRAMATLLGADGSLDVLLADQNFDREWVPNYGVWKDEWQTVLDKFATFGVELSGGNCGKSIDREWPVTDCFFGGSWDVPMEQRTRLDRPYYRIDRNALRDSLTNDDYYRVIKANHISEAVGVNMYKPVGSLMHDEDGTTIQLKGKDGKMSTVRAKIVVDGTGHETKLVLKDARERYTNPGFQIAYGALVEIDEANSPNLSQIGPYDKEAMTLFDYRTDHFTTEAEDIKANKAPTFMYAMPLKDNLVFFEETSLVARPAMSFQECKDRCFKRLEYLGIKTTKIYEEEFCYIPMGGALPMKDQRVFGFGGAAAMVHPSTGYHLCRGLMGATDAARAIKDGLSSKNANIDQTVGSAYHALWSPENIRQRNFAVFGGEFLMKQNVVGLRGFFDGFFRLPLELWGGFLAGWPGLAYNENHESWSKRIWYGLSFVTKLPLPVAADMLTSIIGYSLTEGTALMQSVTPIFGEPDSFEYKRNTDRNGDVAAKTEAVKMIKQSTVTAEIPVAFDEDGEALGGPKKAVSAEKNEDKVLLNQLNDDKREAVATVSASIQDSEMEGVAAE